MSLCIGAIETWPIPQLLRLDQQSQTRAWHHRLAILLWRAEILPVMRSLAADSPHLSHSACPCLLAFIEENHCWEALTQLENPKPRPME